MTRADVEKQVVDALAAVAPEIGMAPIDPDAPLRRQVELDSMDFLRVAIDLRARLGVEIPEADYGRLDTLRATVDYLLERLGAAARP
jgi:acyl carrier protein